MPNFVSFAASIAALAHGEKIVYSINHAAYQHIVSHSINQSPRLFDAPGTEAFALENVVSKYRDFYGYRGKIVAADVHRRLLVTIDIYTVLVVAS